MTGPAIPLTRTVVEAGFTPWEGVGEQFWRASNAAVPTAGSAAGHGDVRGMRNADG